MPGPFCCVLWRPRVVSRRLTGALPDAGRRAHSSAVEHLPYKEVVAGSIPAAPTLTESGVSDGAAAWTCRKKASRSRPGGQGDFPGGIDAGSFPTTDPPTRMSGQPLSGRLLASPADRHAGTLAGTHGPWSRCTSTALGKQDAEGGPRGVRGDSRRAAASVARAVGGLHGCVRGEPVGGGAPSREIEPMVRSAVSTSNVPPLPDPRQGSARGKRLGSRDSGSGRSRGVPTGPVRGRHLRDHPTTVRAMAVSVR